MPIRNDIWRSGIVAAPIGQVLGQGFADSNITWLPEGERFTFDADPFGIWRDERLYVFVEHYDYRVRVGGIDVLCFDAGLALQWRRPALREAWHLSYPFVFEHGGGIWMLPESHRAGALRLYRARSFPGDWEPVAVIGLDRVPVDATPVFFEERWWLFYSPATSRLDKIGKLHVAFADRLEGPWHPHPGNPVRVDRSSARCGGTPAIVDGQLVLPMQDCRRTYGGGIRFLHVRRLTTTAFEAEAGAEITADARLAPHDQGLHTLSACGPVTLFDAKYIDAGLRGIGIDIAWRLRRLRRRLHFSPAGVRG
jgi:hypothetical protein